MSRILKEHVDATIERGHVVNFNYFDWEDLDYLAGKMTQSGYWVKGETHVIIFASPLFKIKVGYMLSKFKPSETRTGRFQFHLKMFNLLFDYSFYRDGITYHLIERSVNMESFMTPWLENDEIEPIKSVVLKYGI